MWKDSHSIGKREPRCAGAVSKALLAVLTFFLASCEDSASLKNRARQMEFESAELKESVKAFEQRRRKMRDDLELLTKDSQELDRRIQSTLPPEESAKRQHKAEENKTVVLRLKKDIKDYRSLYLND